MEPYYYYRGKPQWRKFVTLPDFDRMVAVCWCYDRKAGLRWKYREWKMQIV